jgi:hypothetical protein
MLSVIPKHINNITKYDIITFLKFRFTNKYSHSFKITICPTMLLNIVPGNDAIAKLAKKTPANSFPIKNNKENLQITTAKILEKLEINGNKFLKFLKE